MKVKIFEKYVSIQKEKVCVFKYVLNTHQAYYAYTYKYLKLATLKYKR